MKGFLNNVYIWKDTLYLLRYNQLFTAMNVQGILEITAKVLIKCPDTLI